MKEKRYGIYDSEREVRGALFMSARERLAQHGVSKRIVVNSLLSLTNITTSYNEDGTITQRLVMSNRLAGPSNHLLRLFCKGLGTKSDKNNELNFGNVVIGRWRR